MKKLYCFIVVTLFFGGIYGYSIVYKKQYHDDIDKPTKEIPIINHLNEKIISVSDVLVNTHIDLINIPEHSIVLLSVPVQNNSSTSAVRVIFKSADCGCIVASDGIFIPPQKRSALKIKIDLGEQNGIISRNVVYSINKNGKESLVNINLSIHTIPAIVENLIDVGVVKPTYDQSVSFCFNNKIIGANISQVQQITGPTETIVLKRNKFELEDNEDIIFDINFRTPEFSEEALVWYFEALWESKNDENLQLLFPLRIAADIDNGIFEKKTLIYRNS
jgi:hypothetical protein